MEYKTNETNIRDASRIEVFSDGVFAIAITLLVLELIGTLHPDSDEALMETIVHHWHSFLAFFIGFITILVCWINHHVAFEYIEKADTKLMWINGFLLFVVTLTPFSTAILAGYLGKEGGAALAVFGFNYFLISIGADRICTYAYTHRFIKEEQREFYRVYKLIYRYAIVYTLIVFFICFVSIIVPIFLYGLLFALFAAPKEFAARLSKLRMAGKN